MVCQQPKCLKEGKQCGISGTENPTEKFDDCCKGLKCVVSKGNKLGRPMVCVKKSSGTTSTSTATATATPTCVEQTGYFGPVQIRAEECAAKVNDTIVFNTTCCDVKYNKTAQWYVYFTTGCDETTQYQLVNGADQGSACHGNIDTTAWYAANDICDANVTVFEKTNNFVDTFTLNFTGSVDELKGAIVDQTEVAVVMSVIGSEYSLNVNENKTMISSENSTTFNIGVLSAFDLYWN